MLHITDRLHQLTDEDLHWPFQGQPHYKITSPVPTKYHDASQYYVDPTPCYHIHPRDIIRTINHVEDTYPVGFPVHYYLTIHESAGRTNGEKQSINLYEEGKDGVVGLAPYIMISAKRIPVHPAMLRYVVAHEYGHVVQDWIEWITKDKAKYPDETKLEQRYAKLRETPCTSDYGALRWHKSIAELIANDFRIVVTNVEPDFWPHPGFPHPNDMPEIKEFWAEQMQYRAYEVLK